MGCLTGPAMFVVISSCCRGSFRGRGDERKTGKGMTLNHATYTMPYLRESFFCRETFVSVTCCQSKAWRAVGEPRPRMQELNRTLWPCYHVDDVVNARCGDGFPDPIFLLLTCAWPASSNGLFGTVQNGRLVSDPAGYRRSLPTASRGPHSFAT